MMFRTWIGAVGAVTAIMVCGIAATVLGQAPIRPEQEAVAAIEAIGGKIYRTSDGQVDIVDLKGEMVTDAHLTLLQSFPTVRMLNLDGSRVTDGGLEQLLKLPNLEEVSVRGTQVSPAAGTALKDRHPKIYFVDVASPGLRIAKLAFAAILVPVGLLGVWLIRTSRKKRPALSPRLFARGMVLGILLVVVSVVLVAVSIVQSLGIDFHLADLFG